MDRPAVRTLLWGAAALLLIGLLLCARSIAAQVIPTGAWGLSFQHEGSAPIGNASKEALAKYDAAYLADEAKPRIYLTFDAGYENGCTAQILDTLRAHEVPAAFFLVGNYLEQNPELVRRMVREGHIVGNHTYHHYDMSRISDPDAFAEELQANEALYEQVVGTPMAKYYRPPQGVYSESNLRQAQALGYRTVFWSLAYVDWQNDAQPTREAAFDKLLPRIHNGAIVLLHSTSQTNAAILDELLTRWGEMGYTFGTLDEVFGDDAG